MKQGAFTPRWHGPYEVKAICNSCVATTVKGNCDGTTCLSANHSKVLRINKCHCLLLLPSRSTAAIPWRPDERKVSGPTCIRLGQRISLTHNLKCGRWVWKYSKGPSTQKITVAPKETITWPPGLPDPNCTPQICCSSGTHLQETFRTHSSTKIHAQPHRLVST